MKAFHRKKDVLFLAGQLTTNRCVPPLPYVVTEGHGAVLATETSLVVYCGVIQCQVFPTKKEIDVKRLTKCLSLSDVFCCRWTGDFTTDLDSW
jgi:hypothetical protein